MAVPIVTIVGRSGAGKTTFIERLIPELKRRGYRVATIKHAQEIDLNPKKDSKRHLQAGSEVAAIATSDEIVLTMPTSQPATIEEVARLVGNEFDIIICEGFKHADVPKIEVHFKNNELLLEGLTRRVAIITNEPLDAKIRQFSSDNITGVADLLEKGFIKPQSNSLDLYINDIPVPLTLFPRQIISQTIVSMVSSLKGVDVIKNLKIILRRETKKSGES